MRELEIIKGPVVTEKATQLKSDQEKYLFKVEEKANKVQIKQAIEKRFAVKVDKINIINVKPKTKRVGRYSGKTNKYKKAIVTLVEGNQIEM